MLCGSQDRSRVLERMYTCICMNEYFSCSPETIMLIGFVPVQKKKKNVVKNTIVSITDYQIRSDQISRSVMSDSLQPRELQHARPPCPSPTPGVHSNSCPSSEWYHPAITSSVLPFSSCPQSLPASESFPMSQLFAWGGQSIGVSNQHQPFQWSPRTDLL